jgi:FkbM family methyltransferase
MDLQEVFSNIYKEGRWNQRRPDVPLSGPGSSLKNTKAFCEFLNSICRSNHVQSVVDIGCGDLTWMTTTEVFATRTYTGIDIVPTLIDSHKKKYPHHTFLQLNAVKEEVPHADLIIIRDVLFHLSHSEIQSLLQNVRGRFKYYLITSCNNEVNNDAKDQYYYHAVNLFKAPFFLQPPSQDLAEPTFDRRVCLWDNHEFYCKKTIIYNKFISNYITMEPFTFCKELVQYGWSCISQDDTVSVKKIFAEEGLVLLVTYDHLDIQSYEVNPKCKIIYKYDDQHVLHPNAARLLKSAWQIVSPYAYLLSHTNKIWIPYSCMDAYSTSMSFNKSPLNKVFVPGANNQVYWPFRSFVLKLEDDRLVKRTHPGYDVSSDAPTVGIRFIQTLNEHLCCFTDASAYKYILLKNFEICGSGALLLTDKAIEAELKLLGFHDMVNCVLCDKESFLDKVEFILDPANRTRIDEMRWNGMNLVKTKHLTSHRSKEFHNRIQEQIQKVWPVNHATLFNSMVIYTHSQKDYISKTLQTNSTWEPNVTYYLQSLATKGIMIDVGANIGYFSLLGSALYSHVYSFEPIKENILLFQESVKKNNIKNITIIPQVCGANDGDKLRLTSFPANMGGTRNIEITKKQDVSHLESKDQGEFDVITLDTFIKQNGITTIDLIKIDVEGYEPNVLNGFIHGIKTHIVKNIIFELSPCSLEVSVCTQMLDLLKHNTYFLYDIGIKESGSEIKSSKCSFISDLDFLDYVKTIKQTNILASIVKLF